MMMILPAVRRGRSLCGSAGRRGRSLQKFAGSAGKAVVPGTRAFSILEPKHNVLESGPLPEAPLFPYGYAYVPPSKFLSIAAKGFQPLSQLGGPADGGSACPSREAPLSELLTAVCRVATISPSTAGPGANRRQVPCPPPSGRPRRDVQGGHGHEVLRFHPGAGSWCKHAAQITGPMLATPGVCS